ncbi:hypothetical protein ACFSC6_14155 [Rufibacter sediminis]|uniref:Lipoprotein n=1 Tax=Rufibacter sediminis TaxID=2762756 RepID=A0ABR6VYQ0_9BACT|nr:hypothetical protein [Rufibacter sediminis]MBC3542335.1 hypothetical protein [Rufibacter sediminis]
MKKHRLFFSLAFVFGSLGLTACYNSPDFPMEPSIEYRGYTHNAALKGLNVVDTIQHVIRFRDGDGNIGLSDADDPSLIDFYCDFYVKINGTFQQVYVQTQIREGDPPVTRIEYSLIKYYNRLPEIYSVDRTEPLEGDIKVGGFDIPKNQSIYYKMNDFYLNKRLVQGDTIKYDFYILDRDRNKSNKIESPEIILKFDK